MVQVHQECVNLIVSTTIFFGIVKLVMFGNLIQTIYAFLTTKKLQKTLSKAFEDQGLLLENII